MKTSQFLCFAGLVLPGLGLLSLNVSAQEYPDSVVVVLDASGSMKGGLAGSRLDKMTAAKTALKEVLQKVPQNTHIGLLVFSAANLRNDWAYPLGPRNDAELMKAIELPQPSQGTPLGKYIKKGADRLLEERAKNFGYGTYRLLVVTDGEAQDQDLVDRYTPELMARGITMDVIGVGMKQTHTLARKVHSYRAANDPASLRRALSEVFAEVSNNPADMAQAEAFDWIAPIPNPVALAMLQALSTTGNHPLGTKPKPAVEAPVVPAPPPRANPAPSAASPTPASAPQRRQHAHEWRLPKWMFVVGLVIVISIIRRAAKGARR